MPTRVREAEVAVRDNTSLNTAAWRGSFDPFPFPKDADFHVDWIVTPGETDTPGAEQSRAARALQHHLELIARSDGWKKMSPGHEHPQLTSEPED